MKLVLICALVSLFACLCEAASSTGPNRAIEDSVAKERMVSPAVVEDVPVLKTELAGNLDKNDSLKLGPKNNRKKRCFWSYWYYDYDIPPYYGPYGYYKRSGKAQEAQPTA